MNAFSDNANLRGTTDGCLSRNQRAASRHQMFRTFNLRSNVRTMEQQCHTDSPRALAARPARRPLHLWLILWRLWLFGRPIIALLGTWRGAIAFLWRPRRFLSG